MSKGNEKRDEKRFYPAVKDWLSKQGWNSVISTEAGISIPTGPYFPKITIQPDVLGLKTEMYRQLIVAVELESSAQTLYQGLGQCALYLTMSDFVYLALPKYVCDSIRNPRIFKQMKLGLLEYSEHEPMRKTMSPITVTEKFKAEQNYSLDSAFHNQLSSMLKDYFQIS